MVMFGYFYLVLMLLSLKLDDIITTVYQKLTSFNLFYFSKSYFTYTVGHYCSISGRRNSLKCFKVVLLFVKACL